MAQGAGIFAGGPVTVRDAAIVGNATTQGATTSSRQGGGIFVNDTATLERVLVSGNTATSIAGDNIAQQGGGIFDNGAVTLINVTVADNLAVDVNSQGGAFFYNDAVTLRHTIVSGNTTGAESDQCFNSDTVTSAAANLTSSDAADCGFTVSSDVTADPLLGPLADNGGPTDTRAPAPGSPALDRVPFGECPPTTSAACCEPVWDRRAISARLRPARSSRHRPLHHPQRRPPHRPSSRSRSPSPRRRPSRCRPRSAA